MSPTEPTSPVPPRRSRLRAGGLAVIATLLLTTGLLTACDNSPVVLEGSVTYSSGMAATVAVDPNKPLAPGVPVELYADDAETLVAATTTNLVGHFAFHSSTVADGSYRLLVGDQWYGGSSWGTAASVELGAAEALIVDVELVWAGTVGGQIVDSSFAAQADVAVWATDADGNVVATTMSKTGGWFTLGLPTDGTYTITIKGTGDPVTVGGTTATEFVIGSGSDALDTGRIDVATGLAPVAPWNVTTTVTTATEADGLQVQVQGTGFSTLPTNYLGNAASGVYAVLVEAGATFDDINGGAALSQAFVPKVLLASGNLDTSLLAAAASLDPEADYEVVVWSAHGNLNSASFIATAPVTLTAEQHEALFS